ncbi:hypothetical protein CSUB01_08460 [Colletotrichum sublineola]|uniref:Suppressor protein SRP40 n=1 Tax=Colletotrichum sublineola TaxID=1173701 RepID=A0A066XR05_COLSU|nr:hypothetical protein CSUB01_08460 [Colletotrichum sublineola]
MTPSVAPTTIDPAGLSSDTSSAYTRLHITPFDQDLLKIVVPPSALPNARNLSFHTIETFPEKRYGFVDLPEADAEKLKKKLNGAVLKGVKMRIEKARPVEDYTPTPEDQETGKKRKKKSKDKEERKRQKRDENVIEGVKLHDRKVKRGWTVPEEAKIREKKSKKDKEKKEKKDKTKKREERSKYTEKEECLLKTKLPVKQLPAATEAEDEPERKKRKKKSREVIIHEFEKTTKFPTFLKATKPAPVESLTTEYVEGKGWIDAEGNVIEPPKTRRTATAPVPESKAPKASKKAKAPPPPPPPQDEDDTSSSGTSSDEDTSSDESSDDETEQVKAAPVTPAKQTPRPPRKEDDTTSSSGSSSADSSSEDGSDGDEEMVDAAKISETAILETPLSAIRTADASRPISAGSNVSLTIKIPPPSTPSQMHPLEALYKRPKQGDDGNPQAAKEAEPFSFFGGGADNDDLEEDGDAAEASQLPMTPFTAEEFQWRNVRSAAPTPDTAHPNHTKPFWAIGAEGEDEDEDEETREEIEATLNAERNAEAESGGAAGPGGDFQKWFWDNRKNLNQSWMKRRKTAAKERRHRDNKSRASRAV